MTSRRLPFLQFDVFTSRPLQGNPLAVFHRRPRPQRRRNAGHRPRNESVGNHVHPAARRRPPSASAECGSASSRCRKSCRSPGIPRWARPSRCAETPAPTQIQLDLNVGTIPVQFTETPGQPAFGEMTQTDPVFGQVHDKQKIAEVTGIPLDDIHPELPIQTVSTGVPFTILPIRSSGSDPPFADQSAAVFRISGGVRLESFSSAFQRETGRSRSPPARAHAVLQRRRSRHWLGFWLCGGVDGRTWRCGTRRAGA